MSTDPHAEVSLRDYQAAERQLAQREARTGFTVHATVYALVISALVTVNLVFVPQFFWAAFPAAGWGFGLFMHYRFGVGQAAEQAALHQAHLTLTATRA